MFALPAALALNLPAHETPAWRGISRAVASRQVEVVAAARWVVLERLARPTARLAFRRRRSRARRLARDLEWTSLGSGRRGSASQFSDPISHLSLP